MAEAHPNTVDHNSKATAHLLSNPTADSNNNTASSKVTGDRRQDLRLVKAKADIREGMQLHHHLRDTERTGEITSKATVDNEPIRC